MLTDNAIERLRALEEERALKREQALKSLEEQVRKEKNQLASERALKAWEARRAQGTASMSDIGKANIRIGMRDNHAGKRAIAERLKRLEDKLVTLGYSIEEVRSM